MDIACSSQIAKYFAEIEEKIKISYNIASEARKKGLDPEDEVPIPVAKNMAERVVGLISVVSPQITGKGIPERIIELEDEYGSLDWRVGFKIAEEVAKEKFYSFANKIEAIETGIRVGFAYLTLGIVSAPLEGFIGIKIKQRRDGKEYFALQYAGPIRAAGGTAASTSVILADYVRVKMGYHPYDPDENEISRYITETQDYHERVTNLQYRPSEEELRHLVSNLPVEVDGDPTEVFEVSNYKDLPRIETNLIRGGIALVLAEGLSQKCQKLWKRLSKWGKSFDLDWGWLAEQIRIKEEVHSSKDSGAEKEEKKVVKANNTFIMDLVAGRPILTHPLGVGGFRLRYGRTRTSGFSACSLHPATLTVLYNYIAIGTQIKVERPGKAATVTVCDTIEGPIVRLQDGRVLQLKNEEEAKRHFKEIDEIIFLGDILFNYGDFSENGHSLVPAGYCPEWWAQEIIRRSGVEHKESFVLKPLTNYPDFEEAVEISKKYNLPLHPEYIFYWKLVSREKMEILIEWLKEGKLKLEEGKIKKIVLPYFSGMENHFQGKKVLDELGAPHIVVSKENIVVEAKEAKILAFSLNFSNQEEMKNLSLKDGNDGLEIVNNTISIKIRDKAGTFIGARMGRPEKAKMRHLTGSPQVMFPVGEEGGRMRSFQAAIEAKKIRSTFPFFYCPKCSQETIYQVCEECGTRTEQKYNCRFCGDIQGDSCRHGKGVPYKVIDLDINYFFNSAKKMLQERMIADLIKGVKGTSNKEHLVEHLAKGILRAKHKVYVNKDGTTRYDCTELPITHFKPKEVKTSVERLKELGYEKDIEGRELTDVNQILEIKPQDVILPGFDSLEDSAPKALSNVARFVDDLLENFYGMPSFYNVKNEKDLIGHLVIGLAPHISAGLVGRIIGFSETQGLITHPMYHAGMRRDCDGDEACVMLLMDALLNFSRKFLPERRGAKTMDAPLVLTSILNPAEVDDQVHGIDVQWNYPLELYEAALEMKNPWDVKVEGKKITQLADRLGTEKQFEDFGFTHNVDNFNKGVQCSAYKTEPSMQDKLLGQMEIAKKVRAVDMDDVAKLVIQKHFLKDIKGNLRKFSMQQFRCVKCNKKFRRPPLSGKCDHCDKGGKMIFTIHHGSVIKYLEPSLLLAQRYDFSPYLKQTLDLLKVQVEGVFGREKEKQAGLGDFVS